MNKPLRSWLGDHAAAHGDAAPPKPIARFAASLRRGYVVAIAILVLVAIASFLTLRWQLHVQNSAEAARHLLLKQRHDLSRAHAVVGLILQSLGNRQAHPNLMNDVRMELTPLADQLRARQKAIDDALASSWVQDDGTAGQATAQISSNVHEVADRLTKLMEDDGAHIQWRFSLWAPLILEVAYSGPLMSLIDDKVQFLDDRVRVLAKRSQRINGVLTTIALTVLVLEVLLIFSPLLRRLLKLGDVLETLNGELKHAALHDPLTGIGNRKLLQLTVDQSSGDPESPTFGALMILDIDDFKSINDVYGHPAGDDVLCRLTERMEQCVAGKGQVFRSGGDEFVVLWFGPCDAALATRVAQRITAAVTLPLTLTEAGTMPIYCSVAVGVALVDKDQPATLLDLLRAGDLALREAKLTQGPNIVVYGHGSALRVRELLTIGSEFASALERGEVRPYYQPIFDLDSNELVAFEALARWVSPEFGMRMPATFLPMVEYDRRAGALAEVILKDAARDHARFVEAGAQGCAIAVNFTESNLVDAYLPERVVTWAGTAKLDWLTVEVVETALLHRAWPRIHENLARLVHNGAAIALDDFGTGYASLQHLLSVPCKTIKIDQSFVARLEQDVDVQLIVNGMVEMAQNLGIGVVIEGVETEAQRNYFQSRWRGLRAQGYALASPMSADEVVSALKEKRWMPTSTV